ncbi:hypothetical protein D915_000602 [Fasciola hepatica]|uniref:Saposin B-type domain-containing protein n=1 Tax=Fasciola hepatica TaxID=6192 RepID=A0A4E0RY22_FASHE|nr:hypothetical protein D915_000602 [Fasciola hepatica]
MDIPCFCFVIFACALCGTANSECRSLEERNSAGLAIPIQDPLMNEIEHSLASCALLSDILKCQICQYFVDRMHIRLGLHHEDAKRVEAVLFLSIELHLLYCPLDDTTKDPRLYERSGCETTFNDT